MKNFKIVYLKYKEQSNASTNDKAGFSVGRFERKSTDDTFLKRTFITHLLKNNLILQLWISNALEFAEFAVILIGNLDCDNAVGNSSSVKLGKKYEFHYSNYSPESHFCL